MKFSFKYNLKTLPLQMAPLVKRDFEHVKYTNTQGRWDQVVWMPAFGDESCIIDGFEQTKPGMQYFFDFGQHQNQAENARFFINQFSSLFGGEKNRTLTNLHKFDYSNDILNDKHFYYYGNLKEELWDNINYFTNLLNSTWEGTGILTLFNQTLFYKADYKCNFIA